MATGGGAAFQKLTIPEDSVSRSMQHWGGLFAQQAAEVREREERRKIQKEKEIQDWEEKNQIKYDDFKQTITGYNTYDDVGRNYAQKAMDAYVEQYNKAEEAMKNGNTKEMQMYRNNMLKIKGTFSQIKDMNAALAKQNAVYEDMVSKGQMSGVDKDTWEAQNYAFLGKNFDISLDGNFNPILRGITNLQDEDGIEEPFEVPYNQMIDGSWRAYKRQELLGKGGLINTVLDSLGTYEDERRANGNIISSKLWTPKLEQGAKDLIEPMLMSQEVMADLTNQFDNSSKKRTGFTQEERDAMRDKLVKMIETGYSEKYKEMWDKDYANLQEKARHNKMTENVAKEGLEIKRGQLRVAQQNANTNAYKANLQGKKLQHDIDNNKPILKVGTQFVDRVKQQGKYQSIPFQTYTLTNKQGNVQPFIISSTKDTNGEERILKASSVDVSSDGTLMRVMIDGNKNPIYFSKKGNPKSRALFESIESQMGDRKVVGVDIFGQGPTEGYDKPKTIPTDKELQNKYKF